MRRSPSNADRRIVRRSVAVGGLFTAIFWFAVCSWRPWTLLGRGAFSSDFYDAQAHAFLRFRVDVPPEVASIEGFLIDGDTYLYFGPLLALARLPVAVFGHWADGHLVRLSLVVGFAALCAASFRLAVEARNSLSVQDPERDSSEDRSRIALFVAAAACSPALALFGWVSVYHETELWAAVFVVAAAAYTLAVWRSPARRPLTLAIVFVFAAVLTRASVGAGAAAALGGVGFMLWRRDRYSSLWCLAGAVMAPLVHGALNYSKFGSLFGLPAERQVLTFQDPERAAWFAGNDGSFFSVRFLETTLRHYLRPDTVRFERLLPVIRFGPPADDIGSYPLENNTPSSSLTATATLFVVLSLVGLVLIVRRRAWSWLVVAGGVAMGAVPTFLIGFIANRYLVDMVPMLMVPAAFAALAVPSPTRLAAKRALSVGAVALVVWGTWVNLALGTWLQQLHSPGFTEFRYRVDELVFGNGAPGLIQFDPDAATPRSGVVAVDRECRGVYVADDDRWVALERGRGRRVVGEFAPTGDTTVFRTSTDSLDILVRDGRLLARLRTADRTVRGDPVDWDGGTVKVELTSDPITGGFRVTIDDQLGVGQLRPIPLDAASFGPRFARGSVATPLCEQLQRRLPSG